MKRDKNEKPKQESLGDNKGKENNCLDIFHNADIELNGICKMCKGITKR